MLDFASKNLDRAALFFVRKDEIAGYRAVDRTQKNGNMAEKILSIKFSPAELSLFREVISGKQAFWGKAPEGPDAEILLKRVGGFAPNRSSPSPSSFSKSWSPSFTGMWAPPRPPVEISMP